MLQRTFLLFAFSVASYSCAVIPGIPDLGSAGFHARQEQRNVQFGEGIRDWFKNIRDAMREKIFGKESPNPFRPNSMDFNAIPYLRVNDDVMEKLVIQPGNFFVDLTNINFNPSTDWGVRIGNWYIIRKADINQNAYRYKYLDQFRDCKRFLDYKANEESNARANDDSRDNNVTEDSNSLKDFSDDGINGESTARANDDSRENNTAVDLSSLKDILDDKANGESKTRSNNSTGDNAAVVLNDLSVEILKPVVV